MSIFKMSSKSSTYLQNKIRGGEINQRGNNYEQTFATFLICKAINEKPDDLNEIFISSQAWAFVDDIRIKDGTIPHSKYFQLKTSQTLSWGKKFKSLKFDFNMQRLIESVKGISFDLNLVVSEQQTFNDMSMSVPKVLRRCTNVIRFLYFDSISQQILNDTSFKNEILQICAFSDTDKLEALSMCVVGAWVTSSGRNIPITDILSNVRRMGYSWIKSEIPLYLQAQVAAILNNIPNFTYQVVDGYIHWTYNIYDTGFVVHRIDSQNFRNIEMQILNNKPQTFAELEPLFS